MTTYLLIKALHISCAVATLLSFSLRGYWMLTESIQLEKKWVRVLPHIIDTLLLASAIELVVMSRQYPWSVDWVMVKIGLLLLYIVLGTFALKRGKTKKARTAYLALALITLGLIFYTALTKPLL